MMEALPWSLMGRKEGTMPQNNLKSMKSLFSPYFPLMKIIKCSDQSSKTMKLHNLLHIASRGPYWPDLSWLDSLRIRYLRSTPPSAQTMVTSALNGHFLCYYFLIPFATVRCQTSSNMHWENSASFTPNFWFKFQTLSGCTLNFNHILGSEKLYLLFKCFYTW